MDTIPFDAELIGSPQHWPYRALLPLKRRVPGQRWPQVAVLLDPQLLPSVAGYIVVLAGLYEVSAAQVWKAADFAGYSRIFYSDPQALLQDGWVVD